MKLLFVRNMYTAIMANSILKVKNWNNAIALIYAPITVDNYNEYQDNIENILKQSPDWNVIIRLQPDLEEVKNLIYPFDIIGRIIVSSRIVRNKINLFENILLEHKVNEVLITHLEDPYNEVSLHYISDKMKIKCSTFGEIVYDGYYNEIFNRDERKNRIMIKIKAKIINRLESLLYLDYSEWVKYRRTDKIAFNTFYSLFPNLYPHGNVTYFVNVIPEFEEFVIDFESLFLTSSLSEDGIITIDEELELIKNIAAYLPSETTIKFHPRDTHEKKKRILQLSGFREIDVQVEAAEMLLKSPKLKRVSGYITATLFVASKIRPELEINSFIGCISSERINKHALKKVSNDFPGINFHGI